jgi:hypothetical protein
MPNIFWAPLNLKNKMRLFLGIVILLSGILVWILRFTQPTIKSRKDLVFVSGQLNGHDFHDGTRGTHVYIFKIAGYESYFKIKAEFLGAFDKAGFELLDPKEDLTVGIFKQDTGILSIPDKTVFVYAVADKYVNYLDVDKVINPTGYSRCLSPRSTW